MTKRSNSKTRTYCKNCESPRQALEKNQQWLVYDQQREVYVQSVVARTLDLEQQLNQAKQQQTNTETTAEGKTI